MKDWGPLKRSTRFEKSIAEFEAELAGKRIPPGLIANNFIDTTDAENFEERYAQLSAGMRELLERIGRNNVLAFDDIVQESIDRQGYPGGWAAFRDWARRQPWFEEAVVEAKRAAARNAALDERAAKARAASALSYSEQGRMLGMLRVHRMRATSDEERDALTKQIEELEAAFTRTE